VIFSPFLHRKLHVRVMIQHDDHDLHALGGVSPVTAL
jgi:hypothetical protein